MSNPLWTLRSALAFIRALELPVAHTGFCPALLGSVLRKSWSDKDLDVGLIPLDRKRANVAYLKARLEMYGMACLKTRSQVQSAWRRAGSADTKWVEIWRTADGRRVDFFFLECDQ